MDVNDTEPLVHHIAHIDKALNEEKLDPQTFQYCRNVPVLVNHVACSALVDSGNVWRNAISYDFFRRLGLTDSDLKPINQKIVRTAHKEGELRVMGETRRPLRLQLGNLETRFTIRPVVLESLGMAINLSGPFLKKHNIDQIHSKNALRVQGQYIPLQPVTQNHNQIESYESAVLLPETVEIPALCVVHVAADLPAMQTGGMPNGDGVVTGNVGMADRSGALPWGQALLRPNSAGQVRVGLCNPTNDPIKLKAGTRYGSFRRSTTQSKEDTMPWRICVIETGDCTNDSGEAVEKEKSDSGSGDARKAGKANNDSGEAVEKEKSDSGSGDARKAGKAGNDSGEAADLSLAFVSESGSSPTVRQKLNDILQKMGDSNCDSGDAASEKQIPASFEGRRRWLVKEFSLDKSPWLTTSELVNRAALLLLKYWDALSVDGAYGCTALLKHEIHTEEGPPIKSRSRPVNPALETNLRKQIDDWLKRDVIEGSNSPWSFPLVAAPKKNGKIRWCVDYRRLNAITKKDTFPLPHIEDNLVRLSHSQVFSCLDGSGAFHVIEIEPRDRPKTAFSTPWGLYQYKRMPFGLTNGPASYSRLVQLALSGVPSSVALPYLDDTIIHSQTVDEHFRNLEWILQIHLRAGLKLQPEKCQLFQTEVEYLGHLVTKEGICPIPAYVKAVQDWAIPTTKSEARIFLGKVGYYRRFIKDYSKIAGPWTSVTGKESKEKERELLEITPEMVTSFQTLKEKLLCAPVLAYPRFDSPEPFILDTDWSRDANAVGGVLSQVQDNKERVLCYGGKKLATSQRNYGATKGELTAFLHFAKHWRYYLQYRPFILRTDHQPLKHIRTMEPMDAHTARMLGVLADLEFEVQYRPGPRHGNADALSRAPHVRDAAEADVAVGADDELDTRICSIKDFFSMAKAPFSKEQLIEEQQGDPILSTVLKALNDDPSLGHDRQFHPNVRTYLSMKDQLTLQDGVLYYKSPNDGKLLFCLPLSLLDAFIQAIHVEIGHKASDATATRVAEVAFTPHLRVETEDLVRRCVICQQKHPKGRDQRHTLAPVVEGYPFQKLSIDYVGPMKMPNCPFQYILTVRDTFTKWLEAFPCTNPTAKIALDKLTSQVFPRFGLPESLHSDNGTHFTARVFSDVASALGIKHTLTPTYNPKSNPVERVHRDLGAMLRALHLETGQPWHSLLPQAVFAINTTRSASTGFSPFQLLFGRTPSTPLSVISSPPDVSVDTASYAQQIQRKFETAYSYARDNLKRAIDRRRSQYHADAKLYQPGQLVWLFTPVSVANTARKLQTFWSGPWIVSEILNPVLCRLQPDPSWHNTSEVVVSIDRLKPYHAAPAGDTPANIAPAPGDDPAAPQDPFSTHFGPPRSPSPGGAGAPAPHSDDDDDDDDDNDFRGPPAVPAPPVAAPAAPAAPPPAPAPPPDPQNVQLPDSPAVSPPASDAGDDVAPDADGEGGAAAAALPATPADSVHSNDSAAADVEIPAAVPVDRPLDPGPHDLFTPDPRPGDRGDSSAPPKTARPGARQQLFRQTTPVGPAARPPQPRTLFSDSPTQFFTPPQRPLGPFRKSKMTARTPTVAVAPPPDASMGEFDFNPFRPRAALPRSPVERDDPLLSDSPFGANQRVLSERARQDVEEAARLLEEVGQETETQEQTEGRRSRRNKKSTKKDDFQYFD